MGAVLPKLVVAIILTFVLTRVVWWPLSRWLTGRSGAWTTFVLSTVIALAASYYLVFVRRGILIYILTLLGWLAFDLYRARKRERLKNQPPDLDPSKRVYPPK